MRRSWYDPNSESLVVQRERVEGHALISSRYRRSRDKPVGVGECLLYPLQDGPGIGLLVFLPPLLWLLSLPVFDLIAALEPLTRGNWALGLITIPILTPLAFSFAMLFGYALLFLGETLVVSALGEHDHPRWPAWDSHAISEGLGRWIWAGVFGLALGVFPVAFYWLNCGDIDWFDRIVFADLVIICVGYAGMMLAVSLLHDSLLAANPINVLATIGRIGWSYLPTCLTAGFTVLAIGLSLWAILFRMPSMELAALALWGFWIGSLYLGMVVLRMLGLTYYIHADDLGWFRGLPKWGLSRRRGRLYANS